MTGVFLPRRHTAPRRQSRLCLELDWAVRSLRATLYCNVWNSFFTQAIKTASMSSHRFQILLRLPSEHYDSKQKCDNVSNKFMLEIHSVVLCGICNRSRRPAVSLHDFFSPYVWKWTLLSMLYVRLMSCARWVSFLRCIAACFSSIPAILFYFFLPLRRDSSRPCKTRVPTTYV